MPRSPLAQSPAGRLNSTWVRPLASSSDLICAELKSYGNRYSTPLKPALAAASKRCRNSSSVNSIDRLAHKRGMTYSLFVYGVRVWSNPPRSVQQAGGGGGVGPILGQ